MKKLLLLFTLLLVGFPLSAQNEITWLGDVTEIPGPAKYGRMVLMKQGPRAGQILLTYQKFTYGRRIVKRYSTDDGVTWSPESTLLQKTGDWTYANCNIIELADGRLLMTYQKRKEDGFYFTGRDRYVCVKFSSDGGSTWTREQEVFQGGNWEPMPIQIPSGIYIFFTLQDIYPTYLTEEECSQENEIGGRAVSFVASFDNGTTWTDFSDERYTGRMLLRDYNEDKADSNFSGSGGGMPTPFLTGDNRLGFIAESVDRKVSPWIVVAPTGDFTFDSSHFKGDWQTANYNGLSDNNVYPLSSAVRWALTRDHWGGAPFALKLSNGKIAFSYNSGKRIHCWVADENAKNPVKQAMPFGDRYTFYSSMIHLNDSTIFMVAHETSPGEEMRALYLRKGRVKDYVSTSVPQIKADPYRVMAAGQGIQIRGLAGNEIVQVVRPNGAVVANEKTLSGGWTLEVSAPGLYIVHIMSEAFGKSVFKVLVGR